MIAYPLAILGAVLFGEWPLFGALLLLVGGWLARGHRVAGEGLEMLLFYGAVAGCLVAWLGW